MNIIKNLLKFKMQNKPIILNIHNINIIKLVFSYLDYQYILKLIKYNKTLQNKLEIKLDNFKNNSNNPKYILLKGKDYQDRNFYYHHTKKPEMFDGEAELGILCLLFCFTCIYFTYTLIYSILLVSKDLFNDDNTSKDNYFDIANTIHNINLSLFALITSIIIATIIYIITLCKEDPDHYEKGCISIVKQILLILFNLILILFEILIIWKLVLSYEIKKNGVMWFIVMDYIFIFLNFLYILFILYRTYVYFYYYIIHYDDYFYNNTIYSITSLNNIKIKKFNVSEDFLEMKAKEKTKFLLDNYKNMEYTNSSEEKNLINSINEFREKNNLPKFSFNNTFKLPNYIINEPSEFKMHPEQNLFSKLNKKYLFRYPIGEFEKNFKNKDPIIISVLLNDKLNYITIITKDNIEFIYIYQKSLNNILIQ